MATAKLSRRQKSRRDAGATKVKNANREIGVPRRPLVRGAVDIVASWGAASSAPTESDEAWRGRARHVVPYECNGNGTSNGESTGNGKSTGNGESTGKIAYATSWRGGWVAGCELALVPVGIGQRN